MAVTADRVMAQLLDEVGARLREGITISPFARFKVGEAPSPSNP